MHNIYHKLLPGICFICSISSPFPLFLLFYPFLSPAFVVFVVRLSRIQLKLCFLSVAEFDSTRLNRIGSDRDSNPSRDTTRQESYSSCTVLHVLPVDSESHSWFDSFPQSPRWLNRPIDGRHQQRCTNRSTRIQRKGSRSGEERNRGRKWRREENVGCEIGHHIVSREFEWVRVFFFHPLVSFSSPTSSHSSSPVHMI